MKLNRSKFYKKTILGILIGLPLSVFPEMSTPNVALASSPNWCTKSPDKISVGNLSKKYIVDFSSVCRGHDICYWTIGAHKAHCDNIFFSDLQTICRQQEFFFDELIKECDSRAKLYYNAVSGSGKIGVLTSKMADDSFSAAQREANIVANQLRRRFPALDIEQYRQEIALQLATRQASGESVNKSIENAFNAIASRISVTSSSSRIAEGVYWVGATGMGLRVQGEQYQYYDEGGDSPWKPVSELKYIREGVVLAGETYWCLSTLPKPRNTRIAVCSANGWVQAR